ncbi:hypothetical protein LOAG_01389 [Loa loa]|uniref:Uncharacterized protein n=1 Tax=Loa loa TaxID=7209 RepID=A0A1S0U9J1_LOALO|nr:hypothetical protein LOAG_01389 [Loa loa]EFO27100.1 hypothetical protein LOAG_01389 [Loa loa]
MYEAEEVSRRGRSSNIHEDEAGKLLEQSGPDMLEGEWMLDKREKEEAEIHYLTRGAALVVSF